MRAIRPGGLPADPTNGNDGAAFGMPADKPFAEPVTLEDAEADVATGLTILDGIEDEILGGGPATRAAVAEARRRGIPVRRLDPIWPLLQLGEGRYQRRIWGVVSPTDSIVGVKIQSNKEVTTRLLRGAGLPVPLNATVHDADEAVVAAGRLGYPVVLKPLYGTHGRGVCVDIGSEAAVRRLFPVAQDATHSRAVIVERYLQGKDYRVLVINNQVVAVGERVPAHVIGDGEHTVQQLIDLANADPRRAPERRSLLKRIEVDTQTLDVLERQGIGLDDIPPKDRFVRLKLTGNISSGGTYSIDRTDEIHPANAEIARQAALVLEIDVAGIDLITPDIAQPMRETGGAIIEVNSRPQTRILLHATEDRRRQAGGAIVDMLFPPGAPVRVPIVAVVGTIGTTAACRAIARVLAAAGRAVGLATADGAWIAGTRVLGGAAGAAGEPSGPAGAEMVLRSPVVDCAVVEAGCDGAPGLDRCDVAVVTDVAGDLPGPAAVLAAADGGFHVLSADSPGAAEWAGSARDRVIIFSKDEGHPVVRAHVGAGGRAVVLRRTRREETITLLADGRAADLLPRRRRSGDGSPPAAALAAAAVAVAQGVPLDRLRLALRTVSDATAD